MIVTKKNAKVGLRIYVCFDDRPLDGFGYFKGIITELHEDHFLYTDLDDDIPNMYGTYDTKNSSVMTFTTEDEAKQWLLRECNKFN